MKKNYVIVHGSFGSPFENWFSWIRKEIPEVLIPTFPIGVGKQNYENWKLVLECYKKLGYINKTTTLIGHSIAPIFLIHYLLEHQLHVKKLVFISGFNKFSVDEGGEYDTVNASFFCDHIEKIKDYAEEIVCFYSDNDPYVSYDALKDFATRVSTKEILISDAGHFNTESGYVTFPQLIDELRN